MALWAYRTSPRSSIGVSPYSLVYGGDANLPAEIKIPSSRIAAATGVHWNEAGASNSRVAELDTLDFRKSKAEERIQVFRNRISSAYNKTVKPRVFKVGDLVLKTSKHIQQDMSTPKFSPKWEGPYTITKAYSTGYYKIIKVDGGKIPHVTPDDTEGRGTPTLAELSQILEVHTQEHGSDEEHNRSHTGFSHQDDI
ncbi:uncharacterized protein LOC113315763 [Papaver somniferum]|uniref:uncharacterized protein LOC113315763 n=1 Tax=Papaver somniferum TaxID=3469 RepID=UPI000E6FE4E0|nr:uncharacterized protein LOC113315763 [Papaver somniferum]